MTIDTARANIGQPFRWKSYKRFDIIRKVKDDGYIKGDFIEAPCEDCNLKQNQPEQLKKQTHADQSSNTQQG